MTPNRSISRIGRTRANSTIVWPFSLLLRNLLITALVAFQLLFMGEGGPLVGRARPSPESFVLRYDRTSTTACRLLRMPEERRTRTAMIATVITARMTPYSAIV